VLPEAGRFGAVGIYAGGEGAGDEGGEEGGGCESEMHFVLGCC
jgi:hypothetical protein